MSFGIRKRLCLSAGLAVLAPLVLFGPQRSVAHASPAGATAAALVGSGVAASKYGPVTLVVSGGSGATVSLSVNVGKQSFSFTLPARDFTQNATSATLDTHGDLKGYGSIKMSWSKKTVHVAGSKGSGCSKPTAAHDDVILTNGRGTANLHLPCLSPLSLSIGGPVKPSSAPPALPGYGSYQGIVGSFSFSLPNTANVSLTVHKSYTAGKMVDLSGFASRSYAGNDSAAPLLSQTQAFHTMLPATRVSIQNDLGSGKLDFVTGPKQLKGTSVQFNAGTAAIAVKDTPGDACHPATKGVGASRSATMQGMLNVHLCPASGSFPIDSSRAFASFYSRNLVVKPPTPLKLVGSNPANNATGVSTGITTVSVTFSNAMSDQYASATLQAPTDIQFIQKPALYASKKTMTFTLTRALKPNTTYNLTVTAIDSFQQSTNAKASFTTGS